MRQQAPKAFERLGRKLGGIEGGRAPLLTPLSCQYSNSATRASPISPKAPASAIAASSGSCGASPQSTSVRSGSRPVL